MDGWMVGCRYVTVRVPGQDGPHDKTMTIPARQEGRDRDRNHNHSTTTAAANNNKHKNTKEETEEEKQKQKQKQQQQRQENQSWDSWARAHLVPPSARVYTTRVVFKVVQATGSSAVEWAPRRRRRKQSGDIVASFFDLDRTPTGAVLRLLGAAELEKRGHGGCCNCSWLPAPRKLVGKFATPTSPIGIQHDFDQTLHGELG